MSGSASSSSAAPRRRTANDAALGEGEGSNSRVPAVAHAMNRQQREELNSRMAWEEERRQFQANRMTLDDGEEEATMNNEPTEDDPFRDVDALLEEIGRVVPEGDDSQRRYASRFGPLFETRLTMNDGLGSLCLYLGPAIVNNFVLHSPSSIIKRWAAELPDGNTPYHAKVKEWNKEELLRIRAWRAESTNTKEAKDRALEYLMQEYYGGAALVGFKITKKGTFDFDFSGYQHDHPDKRIIHGFEFSYTLSLLSQEEIKSVLSYIGLQRVRLPDWMQDESMDRMGTTIKSFARDRLAIEQSNIASILDPNSMTLVSSMLGHSQKFNIRASPDMRSNAQHLHTTADTVARIIHGIADKVYNSQIDTIGKINIVLKDVRATIPTLHDPKMSGAEPTLDADYYRYLSTQVEDALVRIADGIEGQSIDGKQEINRRLARLRNLLHDV
jgi:hypothetical protein